MNLEKIQEMWERDATIDPDNLHNESLKIPQLHSKYYTIYNTISLLREKARDSYNRIRLERYNYYTGKAPAEVYAEDPFRPAFVVLAVWSMTTLTVLIHNRNGTARRGPRYTL